ncbi:MAG: glycosyltransferase [Bacteroidales bacterium]|nr:glycosyltransferase [Bacteroidales bacterium]
MKKLSIVTINYNNVDGLKKTIDSVLTQTWQDFEWIIIDGGSSDGSKDLIEQTSQFCDKISFWCSEPDKGIYNALNKGLSYCSGEYVSCMNSGDLFYDEDVLNKVFAQNKFDYDVIYGKAVDENGEDFGNNIPSPISLYDLYYGAICHQAMFVRTSILKENGFNESYKIVADYAKWLELCMEDKNFYFIDTYICRYDTNGFSSSNIEQLTKERVQATVEILPTSIIKAIEEFYTYRENYYCRELVNIKKQYPLIYLLIRILLKSVFIVVNLIRKFQKKQ